MERHRGIREEGAAQGPRLQITQAHFESNPMRLAQYNLPQRYRRRILLFAFRDNDHSTKIL